MIDALLSPFNLTGSAVWVILSDDGLLWMGIDKGICQNHWINFAEQNNMELGDCIVIIYNTAVQIAEDEDISEI